MKLHSILLAALTISLTSCAATGKLYDATAWDAEITQPNQARVTVFRTTETMVAAGSAAHVTLGGSATKYCAYGGYTSLDTGAGKQVLTVKLRPEKNRCEVPVTLLPGEERFFEIKTNRDFVVGNAISAGISAGMSFNGIYGTGGRANGGENCATYFSLIPVKREDALKMLSDLRETKQ